MGNTTDLVIALLAKDAASGVLGAIGGKLDHLGKAGDVAKVALGALTAGIGVAVVAGIGFAKAAADEEQGVVRLGRALSLVTESAEDYASEWETAIAEMEKMTAFSDGEMRDSLSMMVALTGDADEAWKRLPIAMDLARGAGIDLASASKLLGKTSDENTTALGRLGIKLGENASASDVLLAVQAKFGGQAGAFAETATGKWQIFNNQIDNLKEDIGSALLPLFSGMADVGTKAIDTIREALAKPEIQEAISFITSGLGMAKDIFVEIFGVLTGSAPDAGAALTKALGPETAGMIMGAVAMVRDIVKAVFAGDIPAVMATLKDRIPPLLQGLLSFVGDAIPKVAAAMLGWAKEFIAWIAPQIPPMLNELLGLLKTALIWLGDHTEEIGAQLVEWGLQFGRFVVEVAIPKFLEFAPQIVSTIVNWAATEALPAIVRAAFNLGKGIVGGIADALGEGIGAIASAFGSMIRAAVSSIDFWVGPFHISGTGGITVQMPTISFPSIGLPSFDRGGVVPGPIGAPRLVVAHGGETITRHGVARATGDQAGQQLVIPVIVDGREIARALGPAVIPLAALSTGRRL